MSLQSGKNTGNATASLRGRHFGASVMILALMFSALLVTGIRATTLLDPTPENSTTLTTMLMFFGDGTGGLIAGPAITVGAEPHTAVAGDFNEDGHLDVVVSNRTDGTIILLFGDGTGNFPTSTLYSVICPTCLE